MPKMHTYGGTMKYRYATIFTAKDDGEPPNDNIKKGDRTIKPGKHDNDDITYLNSDGKIRTIRFNAAEVIDAGSQSFTEAEIIEIAKNQATLPNAPK